MTEVGAKDAESANEDGHLRSGQGEQLRAIDQQILCAQLVAEAEIVAETVRCLLQRGEGRNIGLLLRGVGASRSEGNLHFVACLLGRSFHSRAAS